MAAAYDGERFHSEAALTYRTESTGCPDQACRWEDWVDCPVQFHVSIYAANSAFLRSNDSHLHFAIINECVQDGLNVLHGQLYLESHIRKHKEQRNMLSEKVLQIAVVTAAQSSGKAMLGEE